MAAELDRSSDGSRGVPGWVLAVIAVIGVVALIALWVAYSATTQGPQIQQTLDNKVKAIQQDFNNQVAELQKHQAQADTTNASLQSDLGVVTKKLSITQNELKTARTEAAAIKAENEQKLAEMNGTVTTQLATKATTEDVKTVDSKVAVVRTDLDSTKNDLKMARSELGTLIARNHDDVEQLRKLGERNYIEFTIDGKNKPQKVGSFTVELLKTDLKKKRFNVGLTVDEVRIEKKNQAMDEPVFFHQGSERRPMEFVVNTVAKDKVTGYISTPKS